MASPNFCFYNYITSPPRSIRFISSTFDSNLWTRRSDIWYSNSKSDSMSDTATQKTVASIVEGWETWAGSDRTLGSIRLVDDVQDPGLLPVRERPWLLQACKSKTTWISEMHCVQQVCTTIKVLNWTSISHSCLYAVQSCTARGITRLVATLAKLLGNRVGALVALWRQTDKSRTREVQLTCALSVHQFVTSHKVWWGRPVNQTQ